MDKIMFLAALAEKLSHYPLSDEDINICVAEMTRQFEVVSDEDFAKENPGDNDVAIVAEGLYKQYSAHKAAKEAQEAANNTSEETISEPISEPEEAENITPEAQEPVSVPENEPAEDFFEALARETQEERKDQERLEEFKRIAIERAIAENDELLTSPVNEQMPSDSADDPIVEAFDPANRPDIAYEEFEKLKESEKDTLAAEASAENDGGAEFGSGAVELQEFEDDSSEGFYVDGEALNKADDDPEAIKKHKEKMKEKKEKIKGSPLFWTIFIITLPITIPLLAVIASLFAAAYVVVTALIIAVSAATICCVAGGTVLSLVGIIYGVIELFNVVAIGLYELGLGIAIGGATMLVSVLLYNVAIRFAPRLYKCVFKLAKLTVTNTKKLYYKIKKECGR